MSMLDPNEPEAMKRNRCVNCSLLIPTNHQVHSLQQASATMFTILQSWITPTELSVESILCMECMLLLQDRAITFNADGSALPLPAFGHRSVCFSYGISLLRTTRTYTSTIRSNCQERNIILRHVPLQLVSRFERVCGACWMSSSREVRHQTQHDDNRPTLPGIEGENISAPPPLPQPFWQRAPPRSIQPIHAETSED